MEVIPVDLFVEGGNCLGESYGYTPCQSMIPRFVGRGTCIVGGVLSPFGGDKYRGSSDIRPAIRNFSPRGLPVSEAFFAKEAVLK